MPFRFLDEQPEVELCVRPNALAPKKNLERELLSMLRLADQLRRNHPQEKLARTVTQFVVSLGCIIGT